MDGKAGFLIIDPYLFAEINDFYLKNQHPPLLAQYEEKIVFRQKKNLWMLAGNITDS